MHRFIFFSPAIEPLQKTALMFLCTTPWQCTAEAGLEGKAVMGKGSQTEAQKAKEL